ncbi:MAG: hypothetical protein K2Z81_04525, partial [Cyanobacteria bacterium]|nr:hypothetical protein [Cyanobacteriota bacterium]
LIEMPLHHDSVENLTNNKHVSRLVFGRFASSEESSCLILVFLRNDGTEGFNRFREQLEAGIDTISAPLCLLLSREDSQRRRFTDSLTLQLNRDALVEMLGQCCSAEDTISNGTIAGVVIDVDNYDTIRVTEGSTRRNALNKNVSEVMYAVTGVDPKTPTSGLPHLFRVSEGRFFIWAESSESAKALSTRLRAAFDTRQKTSKELFTVSMITGEIPHSPNPQYVLDCLNNAVRYLRKRGLTATTVSFEGIPRKSLMASEGAVDEHDYDPFAIISRAVNDQSTGLLTAKGESSTSFAAFFDDGRIVAASTGSIRGYLAVIEFLTGFAVIVESEFDHDASLSALGPWSSALLNGEVKRPVEWIVDKSVSIIGASEQAKLTLGRTNHTVFPLLKPTEYGRLNDLEKHEAYCDVDELTVCKEMMEYADGSRTLQQLFDYSHEVPMALKWHCAKMLKDSGFIRISAFKAHGGISSRN